MRETVSSLSQRSGHVKFVYLTDKMEIIPNLAQWYFDEWGQYLEESSVTLFESKLREYLNKDKMPLIILATINDEVVGAAQLRFREMSIYPDKEHWLGGVYVQPAFRGKDVASALVCQIETIATSLGVRTLHLQTERLEGGLYAQLGWQPFDTVNYRGVDVLVMQKNLHLTDFSSQ